MGNYFVAEHFVHLAGAVEVVDVVVGAVAVAPPRWTEHHILADREPTEKANCSGQKIQISICYCET